MRKLSIRIIKKIYTWWLWLKRTGTAIGLGEVIFGIYIASSDPDFESKYNILITMLKILNPLLDMMFILGFLIIAGAMVAAGLLYAFGDEKMKTQAKNYIMGAIVGGIILLMVGPIVTYFVRQTQGVSAQWSLFGPPAQQNNATKWYP